MAWRCSKRCKHIVSYGICERCNACGYVTRRDMYNDLVDTSKKVYNSSKECNEQLVSLENEVRELDLACKKISQELTKYHVFDNDMEKMSRKVQKLSKNFKLYFKLLYKIIGRFIKQTEEVEELSKKIHNKIDFK